MKKYWKWLLLVVVIIVAIIGVIFYRRDSSGKPFKASLNHSTVMMTPNWNAKVKLSANKGATYTVQNDKGKIVQGEHTTKNGKANVILNDAGTYTIVAKSDNGHVSKKLPVKVKNYSKDINKTTNSVGPLKFKITHVEYKKMTKSKENQPDDSLADRAYKGMNKHYYQVKIDYVVTNNGKKDVDPEYTFWMPKTDDNQEFSVQEPTSEAIGSDSIIGTSTINPKTSRSGSVLMLSPHKFSVKHFKFSVGEIINSDGDTIAKGGTAQIK